MKIFEIVKYRQNALMLCILFLISLIYIMDTGPNEIQPWDEAMYIVRAKAILNDGNIFDQTENSVGGLYSAAHPPLFIWLTAISISVFGENHFAVRLLSVLFGISILLLTFNFFKDKKIGFIASLISAVIPIYYFYSHQAQLDIAVTFFMLLSIFLFNRYEMSKSSAILIFAGLAWGLSMMTKIAVGLVVPCSIFIYYVILILQKEKDIKVAIIGFLILLVSGLIIFLPWHIYMILTNSNFLNYFFDFHIFQRYTTGVESNSKALGIFYYFNQLIVIFSGTLPFIYFSFKNLIKTKSKVLSVRTIDIEKENSYYNKKANLLLLTFVLITLFVISFSATKLQTYIIMIIPFVSLMVSFGLKIAWDNKKGRIIFTILTVCIALWSLSPDFRNDFKRLLNNFEFTNTVIWFSISAFILIFILHFLNKKYNIKALIVSMFLLLLFTGFQNPRGPYSQTKIENISNIFFEEKVNNLVFIDIKPKSLVYNPQITYYFRGIDLGWLENKYFTFIDIESLEYRSVTAQEHQNINDCMSSHFEKNSLVTIMSLENTYVILTNAAIERVQKIDFIIHILNVNNLIIFDSSYHYYKINNMK